MQTWGPNQKSLTQGPAHSMIFSEDGEAKGDEDKEGDETQEEVPKGAREEAQGGVQEVEVAIVDRVLTQTSANSFKASRDATREINVSLDMKKKVLGRLMRLIQNLKSQKINQT